VAALCKVGRTTVGYWVRSKKLFAFRNGRRFAIPEADLLHFLEQSGQPIPSEFGNGGPRGPMFKSFRNCWTYWPTDGEGHRCEDCAVFKHRLADCFCIRENGPTGCPVECRACRYFREMVAPRVQFIHQFDSPAAVVKDMNLWAGNAGWAELCGRTVDGLIGLGIEAFIHPMSLAAVIPLLKKAALGEKIGMMPGTVVIVTPLHHEKRVGTGVFPLHDPAGAYLLLAGPPHTPAAPLNAGERWVVGPR
jgi:excisionase family DNA binding protein